MLRTGRSDLFKLVAKWVAALSILGIASYPIIIAPMMNPTEYNDIQKLTRKDIDRSKIQPGNMKIWSDPFGRT